MPLLSVFCQRAVLSSATKILIWIAMVPCEVSRRQLVKMMLSVIAKHADVHLTSVSAIYFFSQMALVGLQSFSYIQL